MVYVVNGQKRVMFFKKKVPVSEYCNWTLLTVFSQEQEATWDTFRATSADPALSKIDRKAYFDNLRALFLQVMLIAVTKNSFKTSFDALAYTSQWLKHEGKTEIAVLCDEYNAAFGTPGQDGIVRMVRYFSFTLTGSAMRKDTEQLLVAEFYEIMRAFYKEFESIRLVAIKQ